MLHVHRAERADRLAEALATILAEPPEDPFTPEVIAVPTRGMERWLTQRLSARLGTSEGRSDGICANVEFPFPGRLIGGAIATASGIDPDDDPWPPERSVWPLLHVVETSIDEEWMTRLSGHLRSGAVPTERRFGRVRVIAELFHQYGIRRPAMLQDWARGDDLNGAGAKLAEPSQWQAELWRRLRAEINVPSPAERLADACARLREQPLLLDLPGRISLFGLTRLPASYLDALSALGAGREVHLFLLHPSPDLWTAIARAGHDGSVLARSADKTIELATNRLLASWGADSRELQLVVASHGHGDHHHPLPPPPEDTLLQRIQADIRLNRKPIGIPLPGEMDLRMRIGDDDRSIEVHACHGPARQVEVLREAILHLLAEDETLEPRDVIVMCPDIETFAPLIQATFGSIETYDDELEAIPDDVRRTDLRVRLADRSLRQTNPVLAVVAELLDLAEQRLTASQMLDLAGSEPVRRRFWFDDDGIARIQDWIVESGIRWGLDAAHRSEYRLDNVPAGTWRSGLSRILLGVAMSESGRDLYEGVLPVEDVESGAIELAGRFTEFVDRTGDTLDVLRQSHTVVGWAEALGDAADALCAVGERESWQRRELDGLLAAIVEEAGESAQSSELAPAEVRGMLRHRLAGRPTRANFRTGHLTVCTLVPMRSVPHRVVCLLGLDDGAFPRKSPRDGDDLLLETPHVGDRDPRTEDRQMLLDAVLAAEDRLLVMFSGNDERTNAPLPPAVPVGELLDAVDRTAQVDDGRARDRILVRHPLQPFDPRNFISGALVSSGPWGFDHTSLEGALALGTRRSSAPPFLDRPLPEAIEQRVALDELIAFAERPIRAFLRQRLGVTVGDYDDEIEDGLPVDLDGLERWKIGQRLLEGVLAGYDAAACCRAEIARGTLPPGQLGMPVLHRIWPTVELISGHAKSLVSESDSARTVGINAVVGGDRMLIGSVSGVRGNVLLAVSYSRLNARHRLAAWVRLLALSVAFPGTPFEAVTIGKAPYGTDAELAVARIPPLDGVAADALADLLALRDLGLREPLPIPPSTAAAYVSDFDPDTAGSKAWTSGFKSEGEDVEAEHVRVFGGVISFAQLLEVAGFPEHAHRLWDALLAVEQVTLQ